MNINVKALKNLGVLLIERLRFQYNGQQLNGNFQIKFQKHSYNFLTVEFKLY